MYCFLVIYCNGCLGSRFRRAWQITDHPTKQPIDTTQIKGRSAQHRGDGSVFYTLFEAFDDLFLSKGLTAEIEKLAKADATAFLFNTADGNAQQQFKGMQPGAAGGKTPPPAGKEPKDMNYDELCAYLEANPGAKLE